MKKVFSILATISLSLGVLAGPANAVAEEQWIEDNAGDAGSSPGYLDITSLSYSETPDRPNVHYFHLGVNGVIPSGALSDGLGSWIMIQLDADMDGSEDYRLEVSSEYWSLGTRSVPVSVWDSNASAAVPGCTALMYVLPGSSYYTFTIDYSCLKLPRRFWASGYSQYAANSSGSSSYDWAPDDTYVEFTHSFNGAVGGRRALDKPTLGNEAAFKTASPTNGMKSISSSIENATVTVYCQEYVGVGWALNANIPANVKKDGFKSFIVTSYSNISACIESGVVRVSTYKNENFTGYLSTWDADNDLAGFYVETALPTLAVRGEKPAKNWWVGSIGSSIVDEDVLLQGKITANPLSGWNRIETSMLATEYTYGAPVLDKSGRVLGTIINVNDTLRATFTDSTALCSTLVSCGKNKVWISGLKSAPKTKAYSNCTALNKVYAGGVSQSNSKINKGKSIKNSPYVSSAVYNKNMKLDKDKDGIVCEK